MAHGRKKAGGRKDHKVQRMREDLAWRQAFRHEEKPSNDQQDLMDYKPGTQSDHNRKTG